MKYLRLSGLLLVMLLAGCAKPEIIELPFIKFKILDRGQSSGVTFSKLFHITKQQDFLDLWTIHSAPNGKPPPRVDFEQDMVIAAFLGERRTGGYDIYVHSIEELENELVANIVIVVPPPDSMRSMMISQPYMFVSLPMSNKPVRFNTTQK